MSFSNWVSLPAEDPWQDHPQNLTFWHGFVIKKIIMQVGEFTSKIEWHFFVRFGHLIRCMLIYNIYLYILVKMLCR